MHMSRLGGWVSASFTLLLVVLAPRVALASEPTSTTAPETSEATVQYTSTHFGLSAAAATEHMEVQAKGWNIVQEMGRALGPAYGGVWLMRRPADIPLEWLATLRTPTHFLT